MEKTDLSYLVSNIDIENKFKGDNIKIIKYSELQNHSNIKELLPQKLCACFMLIQTSDHSGHWTVILRNNNNLYYYDSYGIKPDGELTHIKKNLRYELGEARNYLTMLLNSSGMNLTYNKFQFQAYHKDINTCGKWCVIFCIANFKYGLNIKQFNAEIKHLAKIYKEDEPNVKDFIFDRVISLLYETY